MSRVQSFVLHLSTSQSLVTRWLLGAIVALALILHLWGIQRNLPFTPEADEPNFVGIALQIASTGDLNPHWFGHPGSTVIYPLALLFRLVFGSSAALQTTFATDPSRFFVIGRLVTAVYGVLTVPLLFLIGQRTWGTRVGLLGAWFFATFPLAVAYAQVVRTDSSATFFAMLSLWLCITVYERPTINRQLAAGAAIGLAIASRYFMVTLVPVLVGVDIWLVWQQRSQGNTVKPILAGIVLGGLAIGLAFVLATPYFLLDLAGVVRSLRHEARSTSLGGDGLSPLGNVWWYVTSALPEGISWPMTVLALLGGGVVAYKRRAPQIFLLGYVLVFMAAISISKLHWLRWLVPLLPMLGLFAALAVVVGVSYVVRHWRFSPPANCALVVGSILLCSLPTLYTTMLADWKQTRPSTRILARTWIVEHLPTGSRIAQEWYAAPLTQANFVDYAHNRYTLPEAGSGYSLFEEFSLPYKQRTIESYIHDGYRYAIVSSWLYDRYFSEPQRYQNEVAFYQVLFAQGNLLQEFTPSTTRWGPTVRIYELPKLQAEMYVAKLSVTGR